MFLIVRYSVNNIGKLDFILVKDLHLPLVITNEVRVK